MVDKLHQQQVGHQVQSVACAGCIAPDRLPQTAIVRPVHESQQPESSGLCRSNAVPQMRYHKKRGELEAAGVETSHMNPNILHWGVNRRARGRALHVNKVRETLDVAKLNGFIDLLHQKLQQGVHDPEI